MFTLLLDFLLNTITKQNALACVKIYELQLWISKKRLLIRFKTLLL